MSTTTNSAKTKYKIAFLGNQGVGKSSIIEKYINGRFNEQANVQIEQAQPTVGIDFLAKSVTFKSQSYRLQLWDTAGQERFKSLIPSYLKDAICAIIVFDVNNRQSLVDAEKWLKLYTENKSFEGYSVLVGNKIDLPTRQVSKEQGKRAAADLKIDYAEMSAKTGENVEQLFESILENLSNGKCHNIYEGPMEHIKELKKEEEGSSNNTGLKMGADIAQEKIPQLPPSSTPANNPSEKAIVLKSSEETQKPKRRKNCC